MDISLKTKYEKLIEYIASFSSAAVAFSSGVDSTFLLYAAKEAAAVRHKIVRLPAHSAGQGEQALRIVRYGRPYGQPFSVFQRNKFH